LKQPERVEIQVLSHITVRLFLRALFLTSALLLLSLTLGARPAAGSQSGVVPTGSVAIHFLPGAPSRICLNDTINLTTWTDYFGGNPGNNPELASFDPTVPQLPSSASQNGPVLKVTANYGGITPAQFIWDGAGLHYYRFTYTAKKPGIDTISVNLGDNLGVALLTITVTSNCSYDLNYLASYITNVQVQNTSGKNQIIMSGNGQFSLSYQPNGQVIFKGSGIRSLDRVLSVAFPDLKCSMPVTQRGFCPFNIQGSQETPGRGLNLTLSMQKCNVNIFQIQCTNKKGTKVNLSSQIPRIPGPFPDERLLVFPVTNNGNFTHRELNFVPAPSSAERYQATFMILPRP
jgi:hypothetical protein